MKNTTRLTTRYVTLSLVASFSLLAFAEDGVLPEATVEDLDEAGLVLHEATDVESLQLNLDILVDEKIARLSEFEDRLEELGLEEDLASVAHMRELLEFADLEIVEWMPDATGQSELENPLDSSGDLPDHGMLGAKMPSGDSLVADGWQRTHVADDGTETWERSSTDSEGTTTHKSMLVQGDEVIASSWVVTRADGSMSSNTQTQTKDGGTHTVVTEYENGEVVEERHYYDPPVEEDAGDAGDGADVDGYQPAEGSEGGGYCPLYLAACQLMAEEIEEAKEDPYRLIGGWVKVLPPDEEANTDAPRLAIDPETLVINPDPNSLSGGGAGGEPELRFEMPVIVLPPKPGT